VTDQRTPRGTQRRAHGELPAAALAARQEKVAQVDADNQQQRCDGAHQHQDAAPGLAGHGLQQGSRQSPQVELLSGHGFHARLHGLELGHRLFA